MRWFTECHHAIHWGNNLGTELYKSKNLGHLVILSFIVALLTGLMLFLFDPNIKSPIDGIWSAWVTMTHVGFGDVVPVSFLGRLLASALILFGMVFFSMFTALVSVTLIERNRAVLEEGKCNSGSETNPIDNKADQILAELTKLHERVVALEKQSPPTKGLSQREA